MKAKRIIAAGMSALILISFTGCDFLNTKIDVDKLDEIDEEDWIDALEEIGITEEYYYYYEDDYFTFADGTRFDIVSEIDAETGLNCYYYSRFATTEEAEELFEYYVDLYSDVFNNEGGKFSGTKGLDSDDDSGYIVLNGDFEDEDSYAPYYDILIWKDDVVVMAFIGNVENEAQVTGAKMEIGNFLDALGYPKP